MVQDLNLFARMIGGPATLTNDDGVPINRCTWRTFWRPDGSFYRAPVVDCGHSTCKSSKSYIPPKK
ncbi:hypothetical protein M422DRAFT_31629 [Sphaerobolus stellatus SS14]|uniref:Uncharacterized protein n=1 Tax=Sphaerobolus stellatus (strain SS14) TaxID=990650 RepID=A0A0C9VTF5_SPHS4|nr:hypothetical protein M422DRAFT_31629 [Sphaerobolus stellatus SS14]